MTLRTPIRLTPHRGPLATPSTSPESSPTLSSPPTDISCYSTAVRPTLDVAELERRISTPSPLTRHSYGSRLYRLRRDGRSTRLSPLSLIFESLVNSTSELAKTLAGIVTFCVFLLGLLELSSYTSILPQQPRPWLSMSRFPLPSHTRAPRCYINTTLCEPREQHAAVLQFLFEQIQHAKALSSLSVGLGLPLRAFLEAHRVTIPSVVLCNSIELSLAQEVDTSANLTESLDISLLDFTPGSFIGRSLSLALEELGDLISDPLYPRGPPGRGGPQGAHLHAIYWRTASNLLLEYSAARPRARRLLQHLRALHLQLLLLVSHHHITGSIEGGLNFWWWKGLVRQSTASPADGLPTFVTGLETTIDNVYRLVAYLDWITEYLAQTTLKDVLKMRHRTDSSSCMISLQELFARSKPPIPEKSCRCLDESGVIPSNLPERVEIMVPGSPTVRAER